MQLGAEDLTVKCKIQICLQHFCIVEKFSVSPDFPISILLLVKVAERGQQSNSLLNNSTDRCTCPDTTHSSD
uniref:Uncharacterized protein MANES_09G142700 n=1 Tax=Rhizophora mucronata TaxID=61149 RepID=A0A2P2LKC4_RHIMU